MRRHIAEYLGVTASQLLHDEPFHSWDVTRVFDEDIQSLTYEFEDHGVQLRCDLDERIASIFVSDGSDPSFAEIPFSSSRHEVRERFGTPDRSGEGRSDRVLGEYGPWDRFASAEHVVHIEFHPRVDRIRMITFMRNDVVPE